MRHEDDKVGEESAHGSPVERTESVLEEARRAEDRPPMRRPRRKWFQRAMELGLGERKGD